MKRVLIIWGGWEGHNPENVANKLKELLMDRGYMVDSTSRLGALLNGNLNDYSVIIPVWSCGIEGDIYLTQLIKAVESGVGIMAFHGGIDWFSTEKYYEMIGALYLYDTLPEKYTVEVMDDHVITDGINDFDVVSEKYFMQMDPTNNVLATAYYNEMNTPVMWTKNHKEGRVFYSTLAHSEEEVFSEPHQTILLNAVDWCAKNSDIYN